MIKAILISLLLCSSASAVEFSNTDYTVTGDYPAVLHVARTLNSAVKEITKKWLPEPIPRGMRRTTIHVYVRSYVRAYCTRNLHIYIYSPLNKLNAVLKHELTHSLLCIRYPDLPGWTHEGIASRFDDNQKIYVRILAWSRRSGTYPRLHEIMKGFNASNNTAYAASNSLVKFLLHRSDRYTLFLYSTQRCTLERAYGYSSIRQLQQAWVKWLNAPAWALIPVSSE